MPRSLSRDTDPRAERVRLEILRRLPARRKAELTCDACRTARLLALAGLRQRHPGEPEPLIRRRLMDLLLGEETALRVYGPGPGRRSGDH